MQYDHCLCYKFLDNGDEAVYIYNDGERMKRVGTIKEDRKNAKFYYQPTGTKKSSCIMQPSRLRVKNQIEGF